ncbi:hypothetical protein ACFQY0_19545 [Haloferula chungangensis]|uniref:Lipoprotein n=1 Tax=Haloferula chungangensis TaxID=1048331 RepID=A0ABW2LF36_9BACT
MKVLLPTLKGITTLGATILMASCGPMDSVKTGTTAGMEKVGAGFGKVGSGIGSGFGKVAEFTMSPFGPRVPVVEAREDELKELPSGEDQAIAYQQKQNSFWSFLGPINFKEPALPDDSGAMDGGLLPPLE